MKTIYFDYAATSPVRNEVFEEIKPYFSSFFGNPSSIYQLGQEAKQAIETARQTVARVLGGRTDEIFFTSCGSESDNWALRGVAEALQQKGNHIITTKIEHHAVLHTAQFLERHGFTVTYLDVDQDGLISLEELEKAITPKTILISVMAANNEIGTLQPLKEIGAIAKRHGVLFHTDAVQAVGHVPLDVEEMQIDLLSLSGHKLGAPKGIGALYIRKGTPIHPFLLGGGQEKKQRAGTENVASIVGLAKAMALAAEEMEEETARLTALREKLINGLLEKIPHSQVNGHRTKRLPGNCNLSFAFVEGESILMLLDAAGIAASSGSACTSGSLDPSHVLLALGLSHELAHGSVRFTLGLGTTEEEVDYVLEVLPDIVARLREMSPLYEDFMKKTKEETV